jgi:hypothetical protein
MTAHTVAVFLLAALLASFGLGNLFAESTYPAEYRSWIIAFELYVASIAVVVSVLRIVKSPIALDATAALNLLWALLFPFGTALFIWWLVSVRRREGVQVAA